MRSPSCTCSAHDNAGNHSVTPPPPPLLTLVSHTQPFILFIAMPLFISAPVNWSGGEFFCGGATSPLCCFLFVKSGPRVWKGLREKDNAARFNSSHSQTLRHWQGRENISCDTVTLCKNLREAAAAVTHLVVSSTAYDYDSARPLVRQSS